MANESRSSRAAWSAAALTFTLAAVLWATAAGAATPGPVVPVTRAGVTTTVHTTRDQAFVKGASEAMAESSSALAGLVIALVAIAIAGAVVVTTRGRVRLR